MLKKSDKPKTTFITIIVIIFLLFCISLAHTGVNVYETVQMNDSHGKYSDITGYFTELLRSYNGTSVRTEMIDAKTSALVINDYRNASLQETWFFAHKGNLCKFTMSESESVSPDDSEIIMPLDSISFMLITDNLLEIRFTLSDDSIHVINMYIHNY